MSKFTLDWLKSVTSTEFIEAVRHLKMGSDELNELNAVTNTPEGRKVAYEMVNDPDYIPYSKREPSAEEVEQIAADEAQAAQQAAEAAATLTAAVTPEPVVETPSQQALRAAEDAQAAAIGAIIVRDAQGNLVKIVVDYQARGEDGRAIGRPTHFEGHNWVEITSKLIAAHENAVKYGERVKNNKYKLSQAAFQATEHAAAAQVAQAESDRLSAEALKEQDPVKMKEAVSLAARAQQNVVDAEKAYKSHGTIVANTWLDDHKHEFVPNEANMALMGDYIRSNNLTMSYEALDKTFSAVKHKLSSVPQQVEQVPVSVTPSASAAPNAPAAATAAATVAPASITQADIDAAVEKALKAQLAALPQAAVMGQEPTPAAANTPQAARRPGVNGGLQPGASTAARPSVQTNEQTTTETRSALVRAIAKMSQEEFRKKLRDVNYVKQLEAAGVKYR